MRKSRLSPSSPNMFQEIKKQCVEAQAQGIQLMRLSIGQPCGPALESAREVAATAIKSAEEAMHEYQDNGSPGCPDFAKRFVHSHMNTTALEAYGEDEIAYLPIPGIKPMLGVVIDSMGAWEKQCHNYFVTVATTRGYPTPEYMAKKAKGVYQVSLPFDDEKDFLFSSDDLGEIGLDDGDLLMLNLPNNPTGTVAQEHDLEDICEYCSNNGVRVFNDAAYSILRHDLRYPNLAEVAIRYKDLSWAEAYSASKAGNMTGWRIGAMVGSPDFIGDIAKIKGETDSGFNAALACGVIDLFENHRSKIDKVREIYENRMNVLIESLTRIGMVSVSEPRAGFFTLFKAPKEAFGESVSNAKEFNNVMIKNRGIVGVPFGPYIRYAVCTLPVVEEIDKIVDAFQKAKIKY